MDNAMKELEQRESDGVDSLKSFAEEFPSLCRTEAIIPPDDGDQHDMYDSVAMNRGDVLVSKSDLLDCCLDRARVKEAIKRLKTKFDLEEGGRLGKYDALCDLEDELGLGEREP